MAKRAYTYDPAIGIVGAKKAKTYQTATGKHAGYDFVDPQGKAIAKAAGKGLLKGIGRIVAGPKR